MQAEFWDVKAGKKVTTEVVEAKHYEKGGYAFKGKTADGRSLTRFISKDTYDKFIADGGDAAPAKKCGCKKSCKK